MERLMRPSTVARALAPATVAIILTLTLWPSPTQVPISPALWPTHIERLAADFLANILLFVPLGLGLTAWGIPVRLGALLGVLVSASIEFAQVFLPGRQPSGLDILANGAGTWVGLALATAQQVLLVPPPKLAARLALGTGTVVLLICTAAGALLKPSLPGTRYFGQHTPQLGHLEWYRGEVLQASVGHLPIRVGALAQSDSIRRALHGGERIEVHAVAGPPVPALASLVSIYDEAQREVFLLGPDQDDLVFRIRRRAAGVGFDQPHFRLQDAFANVAQGDTLRITVHRDGPRVCLTVNHRSACAEDTLARGWSLLSFARPAERVAHLLDALWIGFLALPLGLWTRSSVVSAGGTAIALGAVAALPWMAYPAPMGGHAWLAAVLGFAAGWGVRRWTTIRRTRSSLVQDR